MPGFSRRLNRRVKGISVILVSLLAGTVFLELFCRVVLGLGDPPLLVRDGEIGYLGQPGRYRRFHHTIRYNSYHMRGDDIGAEKSMPSELRILVCGDSIVNGTAWIDQKDTATERLRERLQTRYRRPVTVANVSACGWGPANVRAYLRRFGLFQADMVCVVLNSDDYHHVRAGGERVGASAEFPARRPCLALEEVLFKYLPRLWRRMRPGRSSGAPETQTDHAAECEAAVRALVRIVHEGGAVPIVLLHAAALEMVDPCSFALTRLGRWATEEGAQVIFLRDAYTLSREGGRPVWRDGMHLNVTGQAVLSTVLEEAVAQVLEERQQGATRLVPAGETPAQAMPATPAQHAVAP